MKIGNNTVVSFQYLLRNDKQEALDSSTPEDPLVYLHGTGELIQGLEQAMAGKTAGEEFSISIPPEDGYGEQDPALIELVPADAFDGMDIEPGMQLQGEDPQGNPLLVQIEKIDGDQVTVNRNHFLAGQTLHFDIKIENVRAATDEEVEHGHAH